MSRPYLTIIIPAYNEARRLPHSLTKISNYLRTQSFSTEILVVENGSTDETSAVVREFAQSLSSAESIYARTAAQRAREGRGGEDGDAGGQG